MLLVHEVGAHEIRMPAEGDPELGLLAEHRPSGVVAEPLVADGLEREAAAASPRVDEVDDPEAAFAEDLLDTVAVADGVAARVAAGKDGRREGHRR